ncbi:hypothetical protein [Fulvivirga ligni]|uniref:hypothetical protein n=1 Tax=Fulvivirga ligni TaxID=2904246 RepID=UPI001F43F45D|nr:hypothetical protein [Fulvivirga ligni]UII20260.1 hypothetical protein LVD16_20665 [Fulvivirga ligni]
MRLSLIFFILVFNISQGQTVFTLSKYSNRISPGDYTIHWNSIKSNFNGENLTLKSKKYTNSVFNSNAKGGWDFKEETIVTGKYRVNGDTIVLMSKKQPKNYGPEFFNYKNKYIVRSILIKPQNIENTSKELILHFIIPLEQIASWDQILKEFKIEVLENYQQDQSGPILPHIELINIVKKYFSQLHIFTKSGIVNSL